LPGHYIVPGQAHQFEGLCHGTNSVDLVPTTLGMEVNNEKDRGSRCKASHLPGIIPAKLNDFLPVTVWGRVISWGS